MSDLFLCAGCGEMACEDHGEDADPNYKFCLRCYEERSRCRGCDVWIDPDGDHRECKTCIAEGSAEHEREVENGERATEGRT